MMTLTTLWPILIGLLVGAAGIVAALFKHKDAQVSKAQAEVAEEKLKTVTADIASQNAATEAVQDAQISRVKVDADVETLQPGEAQKALRDEFSR